MATGIANVFVDGTKLLPYHVFVEQRSDWHHRFEITIATEKAKVGTKKASDIPIMDDVLKYAGKVAEISLERDPGTFNFKGYITDVHIDHTFAGDAFVILKGYSPTYLLDGVESVKAYEEKTLSDIVNDVMSKLPGNIAKKVSPRFTSTIDYVVRYKETQYQFLCRLAQQYGEWFLYDGQTIIFGELPKGGTVDLTFGADSMLNFNYGVNLRPSSFKQQFYKYKDNKLLDKDVESYQPGWIEAHGQKSLTESKKLFTETGLEPVAWDIKDKKHITALAEAKKSVMLSDAPMFSGQSAHPGITVGAEVEMYTKDGFVGNYMVIGATHSFNSNRDYYNRFNAIPSGTGNPPINHHIIKPEAEPEVGVVVDNVDPDKLGRVRVKLKWQEDEKTPWIRVLTNHSGEDRGQGVYGTYFIPEIGDEVFVEFEQANPDRPYVTGTKFHGKIPPEFSDAQNNLKAIKTRSGHVILFDDKDGNESITIKDKNDNTIRFDTKEESITISTNSSVLVESNDITLSAKNDITLEADNNITLDAKNNVDISAKNKVNISGTSSSTVESGKSKLVVDPIKADLNGSTKLKLKGGATADLESIKVKVGGSGMVDVKGAIIKLN